MLLNVVSSNVKKRGAGRGGVCAVLASTAAGTSPPLTRCPGRKDWRLGEGPANRRTSPFCFWKPFQDSTFKKLYTAYSFAYALGAQSWGVQ
eukprot:5574508-Prymnesium_polylepis.1